MYIMYVCVCVSVYGSSDTVRVINENFSLPPSPLPPPLLSPPPPPPPIACYSPRPSLTSHNKCILKIMCGMKRAKSE